MKRFLFAVMILISRPAGGQAPVELLVFSQKFTPGIIIQRDIPAENGETTINRPSAVIQYYIYAITTPSQNIRPIKVWIMGRWYRIRDSKEVKTPVNMEKPVPGQLVPELRKKKAIQYFTGDSLQQKRVNIPWLRVMMQKNEFIFCYRWKGKIFYLPKSTITHLEPVHGQ